jgi:hypothetical protein
MGEGTDVFYPTWFAGTWNVKSKTEDVQAPAGISLFGGNATYASARKEVGSTLEYSSRFLPRDGSSIADREYNVASIAAAALGKNSVLQIPAATPNKLTAIVLPTGAPSPLQVDLIVTARRQEDVADDRFDCAEVVREIVAPTTGTRGPTPAAAPVLSREVETASLYTYEAASDTISCRQRSATFLLPSQQNPTALRLWQAAGGQPVDVRFYDVKYTRKS